MVIFMLQISGIDSSINDLWLGALKIVISIKFCIKYPTYDQSYTLQCIAHPILYTVCHLCLSLLVSIACRILFPDASGLPI